eukprot:CAMPEP_0119094090 /NCGR_PEP_ID=MMETSP1178-20130426/165169_1 /TAXON_ID=33656 /ORGANISM="unid sp, Strain CCMP2000" /LENGTH=53 /DNA_ID=CAMNT_0007077797 /DNA_START=18 /DNA_END=175 /DNA_ORIENTATION=+
MTLFVLAMVSPSSSLEVYVTSSAKEGCAMALSKAQCFSLRNVSSDRSSGSFEV